ncbi:MAG: histidine kinase [Bacteroidales bacterium]|nr:histidine kinase [Bacteroidales bacterium]MCF8402401.1 histidine kinase [Bacteroidales bacterium]
MKFQGIVFLLSIFSFLHLQGQFAVHENYTVNNGLPSSHIYDIIQDSVFNIWFATESGVSCFDGNLFKTYTTSDGLPDNSTVKLYLDYKGRVWFLSYQGLISYIENDSIHAHWLNDSLSGYDIRFFDGMYLGDDGTMFLSHFTGGIVMANDYENTFDIIIDDTGAVYPYWHAVFYHHEKYGVFSGDVKKSNIERFGLKTLFPDMQFCYILNDAHRNYLHKNLLIANDSMTYASSGPNFQAYKNNSIIWEKTFDNRIINLYCDSQNNLWISDEFKGILMYKDADLTKNPIVFLGKNTVSKVLEDHEGNYWFSTTENGAFLVPSVQFYCYDKSYLGIESDIILKLGVENQKLYYSTSNKGFHSALIDGLNVKPINDFNLNGINYSNIFDFQISSDHALLVPSGQYFKFNLDGNNLPFAHSYKHGGYSVLETMEGDILLGISKGYLTYSKSGDFYKSETKGFGLKTFDIAQRIDSTLLLGTIDGLYEYDGIEYSKYDDTHPALNGRITKIELFKEKILVGTFDKGLIIILNDNIVVYDQSLGLSSNRVKAIYPENDTILWVAGNRGLNKLIINENYHIVRNIKYTLADGLPSNEINDILRINEAIWLATDNGLVGFDPGNLINNKNRPLIILKDVDVNGISYNPLEGYHAFLNSQNNITFTFKAQTFNKSGETRFFYKLSGLENDWIITKGNTVRYSKLPAGNYMFNVKAVNDDLYESDLQSFPFRIKISFVRTFYFYILILLVVFLSLFFAYRIRSKDISRRDDLKRQIILAEQNAVRSQMNPHFIFNSLNSIQNFILDNDEKNANIYLVIFSSLIRRILEASKHNFISLKEEVEMIKLYLELEKFRFDKQFDFEINVDPEINPELVSIPSMILQPYLENAIWHGLVPKKTKGKLDIEVKYVKSNKLIIAITDNGIGRQKAALISQKRKLHKPTGIKNVEERLKLLNKLNKTNMTVRIIDLFDDQSVAIGTKVEFYVDI